jgi:twinkle protein
MSQWTYTSCPSDDCGSSDAFAYKEGDEWGHCFSCGKNFKRLDNNPKVKRKMATKKEANTTRYSVEEIQEFEVRGFEERQIRRNISEYFGVRVQYNEDKTIKSHFYPYTKKGAIVGYKERQLPKSFFIHGDAKGKDLEMFGQNVASGSKQLIITEGELDAMAIAQAQYKKYQKFFPVVSIPSASTTNILLEQREFLRRFEKIVLCFDQDEPGQNAVKEAAKIIGFDKVLVAKLPEKDASDVLVRRGADELMNCIFNASAYVPGGIVHGEQVWTEFQKRRSIASVSYPDCLQGINEKTKGMRTGEIALFTSGTGSGKSTVIKEIILDLLEKTTTNIGLVSLEESVGDTAEKFIGMKLKRNLSEGDVSEEDAYKAWKEVFGDGRLMMLDHQGSVSDESLTDKIEHLALLGCKYIVLDHITIAVSEGADGKTGNEAIDSVMSALLKIVKKHDVWLGVISHLRKTANNQKPFEEGHLPSMDDIKGSGSIKQISFDIIGFARNMIAEDVTERNTIKFRVLKCRFTGNTGNAGSSVYNPKTQRLKFNGVVEFENA